MLPRRIRCWLIVALVPLALLWLADQLFPLPLPEDDLARVVLAEDGTPLWRFADHDGVWRYPVTPDEVSLSDSAVQDIVAGVIDELGDLGGTGGVIYVTPWGNRGWSFNTPGMYRGKAAAGGKPMVAIYGDED